jgi:hypothetical protein
MNDILGGLIQNALVVATFVPIVWCLAQWRRWRPAEQNVLWLLLMIKLVLPPLWVFEWPGSGNFLATTPSSVKSIAPAGDEMASLELPHRSEVARFTARHRLAKQHQE